ncbi:excisionase family DNA-binding protein [Salipaludibacillus daqingensis]|uniref:excisionase family DNA-binding protein n=1 Tax=Salipaludibacillus daqingensis TaxID=3041001 RepID=UPI0024750BCB|nr:excisionase family DNA-binding protein [Salipaludibacillus daqingensis]
MYLTLKEASEYLSMPETTLLHLVHTKRIRAVHDGEGYLVNGDQFNTHLDQMDRVKELIEEWKNEPIPEDIDVKDED